MSTRPRSARPFLLLAALGVAGSCRAAPEGWTPVLEETSTSFLTTEVARILDDVVEARGRVESDPARSLERLDAAERKLEGLRDVYLPLLGARSRSYNAYRLHLLERDDEALAALDGIRETVETVGRRASPQVRAELERIGERVADARLRLTSGSGRAAEAFRRLATELEAFVSRGDLFL